MSHVGTFDLAESLLRPSVSPTVMASGRHLCDAAWAVGPREIRDHLVYFVVGPGALRLCSETEELHLSPETFFWLQPGVRHAFTLADPKQPAEVLFFRFFLGEHGQPLRLSAPWVMHTPEPELGARVAELLLDHLPTGKTRSLVLRYGVGALLAQVVTQQTGVGAERGTLGRSQRDAVLKYLRDHLAQSFDLHATARQAELNPDYFSRRFCTTFGLPPRAWVTQTRIHRAAAQLLETSQSVKQIAGSLGYEDLYFFSRQFKRVMGKSPRKYRGERR